MKKRIILGLLALMLAVGCFGTVRAARADDTIYTEGNLYYKIINESITITGCFGKDEEVEVPAMIAGIPVNTIGKGAFWDNDVIKTLKLPDTISKIEEDAIDPRIHVIYNANTDHPQDTPTDLILGLLDPSTPEPPEVTETPVEPTATATPTPAGSGTETIDDTPKPTKTPKASATPKVTAAPTDTPPVDIGEFDIELTETDEPTEAPSAPAETAPATESQAPATPASEPVAEATDAPAPTDTPTKEAETTVEEQPGGHAWVWIVVAGVAIASGAAACIVILKRRSK